MDQEKEDSFVEDSKADFSDSDDEGKKKKADTSGTSPLVKQAVVRQEEEEPPVKMSPVGRTTVFPRKDNIYKKKEALPFDEINSLVWRRAFKNDWKENIKHWCVYMVAGALIGITAFGMDKLEELLVNSNRELLQSIIDQQANGSAGRIIIPLLSYCGIAACMGLAAGIMTVYYGPGAMGSGVAEMIGYMNGVNYPEFLGINTLLTKILGVVLAVSSRLCIGKEGPLAHIGSNWGVLPLYSPEPLQRWFGLHTMQNDYTKRQLIAAGGSAGVAAAFGAPIGGALFAYEMSKPTSFWSFQMIWKTFLTCAMAVLLLGVLQTAAEGESSDGFTGSTIKFGNLEEVKAVNTWQDLFGAIIIGIVGGIMGAFFIGVNFKMNAYRGQILKTKWIKPIETMGWSVLTSFSFVFIPWAMYAAQDSLCQPKYNLKTHAQQERVYKGWCPPQWNHTTGEMDEYFDPNLSLFLATEGDIIKNIMDQNVQVEYWNMVVFLFTWYIWTITTYGTWVPAGLFLPGMIIGCALGQVSYYTMDYIGLIFLDEQKQKDDVQRSYIVLGCAGFMAGYTRMTYSLAVIIMETSNDIQIFLPIMVAITVSNYVAYLFTRSLYERAVRAKQMPVIKDRIPPPCSNLTANDLCSKELVTVQNLCKLEDLTPVLETKHHAFPVLNSNGQFVGLMPRNFLLVLLQERHFYGSNIDATFANDLNGDPPIIQAKTSLLKQDTVARTSQGGFNTLKYSADTDSLSNRTEVYKYFAEFFDINKYPPTPDDKLLPYEKFCRDYWSKDIPVTNEHLQICMYNKEAMIDLRPYLIEGPMIVKTTDFISKIVDYMRKFHMRHIPVIHPRDGKLKGIITRQDLFKWLDS